METIHQLKATDYTSNITSNTNRCKAIKLIESIKLHQYMKGQ